MNAPTRGLWAMGMAAVLMTMTVSPVSATAITSASQFAASCASCHRPDGGGSGIPPIAGLDEHSLVQRMLAYRSDENLSQIMHVIAAALSPEEIEQVAHYLAEQHLSGRSAAAKRR